MITDPNFNKLIEEIDGPRIIKEIVLSNEFGKYFVNEYDIILTNQKIDISNIKPKCKVLANAISFDIEMKKINGNVTIYFFNAYFDGFPHDKNIENIQNNKYYRHTLELLHVEEFDFNKIYEFSDILVQSIGNIKINSYHDLIANIQGQEIDYKKEVFKL